MTELLAELDRLLKKKKKTKKDLLKIKQLEEKLWEFDF